MYLRMSVCPKKKRRKNAASRPQTNFKWGRSLILFRRRTGGNEKKRKKNESKKQRCSARPLLPSSPHTYLMPSSSCRLCVVVIASKTKTPTHTHIHTLELNLENTKFVHTKLEKKTNIIKKKPKREKQKTRLNLKRNLVTFFPNA